MVMRAMFRQGNLEKEAATSFLGFKPWKSRWVVLTTVDLGFYDSAEEIALRCTQVAA